MGDRALRAALCGEHARRVIRIEARKLSRRRGFSPHEVTDLSAEIRLRMLAQIHKYDPARASLETYIDRLAGWATGEMRKARRRLRRGGGRVVLSLDAPRGCSGDSGSLIDALAGPMADQGAAELVRVKVARVLADAPPFDAAVARGLMAGRTENAIALELGESRRQVRGAMERMRLLFERSDLQEV